MVTGGGTLTPYGKGIVSAMSILPDEPEDPGEVRLHPGLQTRVLFNDSETKSSLFLMQVDGLLAADVTDHLRLDAAAGVGFQRGDKGEFVKVPSGFDAFILRRLLASYRVSKQGEIQAGRDFLPTGLNIDDHTSLLRTRNRRAVTDYPTQVRYSIETKEMQLLPFAFAPSFEEKEENREYGAGARGEWSLGTSNSLGGTALYGESEAIRRISGGAFARLSQAHWNGIIGEYVLTYRQLKNQTSSVNNLDAWQHLYYIKPYVAPLEWAELGVVLEHVSVTEPFLESSWTYGPSLNARVNPWVSVIADLRRVESGPVGDWIFYSQLFLHL
jgi:hypothetical protein